MATNGAVTAWGDNQFGQSDVPSGLSNVEHSDDLIHWMKFGSATNATGQILLTVPPSTGTSRFYRLKGSE